MHTTRTTHTTRKPLAVLAAALGALAALVAFTACGKKTSSGDSSSGLTGKAGASAIQFHNQLIEFNKTARQPLQKILDETKKSQEFITYTPGKPMWHLIFVGINPYDKLAENNLAAPTAFAKDDREYFNSRIKLTKDGATELNKIVSTLITYYRADDYKEDKHQKFLDTEPRIQALVEQIAKATDEMGERSEKIASAAERETLKKEPLGIYILNMRDIMGKCEEQMEILMDERLVRAGSGTESKTDAQKAEAYAKVKDLLDPAEALSKEIADMAVTFKATDMSTLKKRTAPTLAKDYEEFFEKLEKQQADVRQNIRFAKEWGYIGTESSMKNLGGTVRDVIGAHNRFIDDVNRGL
ncbi:MAG: hypothetical protein LBM04_05200 [Opitutaceae bacterium]|jgi:ribosomal protein L17|nr:hypothetical protein [Opitutaceae bacterium]